MEQASQPLASSTPFPREYYEALVMSHIVGFTILVAGITPYFYKTNILHSAIIWILIGSYFSVWLIIPLIAWGGSIIRKRGNRPPIFHCSSDHLRVIAVISAWVDLLLLCWTVLLTGGLTGSMYIPVFLAIPACLFLLNQQLDTWEIVNLIVLLLIIGISYWAVSLLDSHIINQHKGVYADCADLPSYDKYLLFRASDDPYPFMWSKRWVNTFCLLAPLLQCLVLFLKRDKKKKSS